MNEVIRALKLVLLYQSFVEVKEASTRKVAHAYVVCHEEKLACDLVVACAVCVPPRLGEINVFESIEILEITALRKRVEH